MGTYVYTLRKKFVKASIDGINIEKIHLYDYLGKPSWSFEKYNKPINMGIAKAHKVWEGQDLPKYCTGLSLEYIKDSNYTYEMPGIFSVYTNIKSVVWWDCDEFPGTRIGSLIIYGGKIVQFADLELEKSIWARYEYHNKLRQDKYKLEEQFKRQEEEKRIRFEEEELKRKDEIAIDYNEYVCGSSD